MPLQGKGGALKENVFVLNNFFKKEKTKQKWEWKNKKILAVEDQQSSPRQIDECQIKMNSL